MEIRTFEEIRKTYFTKENFKRAFKNELIVNKKLKREEVIKKIESKYLFVQNYDRYFEVYDRKGKFLFELCNGIVDTWYESIYKLFEEENGGNTATAVIVDFDKWEDQFYHFEKFLYDEFGIKPFDLFLTNISFAMFSVEHCFEDFKEFEESLEYKILKRGLEPNEWKQALKEIKVFYQKRGKGPY